MTEGIMEELLDKIRSLARIICVRNESPGMGMIDSRNVKTSHHANTVRGLEGNKKIKDGKQHVIVDTQGYLMAVSVHEANIHDSKDAPEVIETCRLGSQQIRDENLKSSSNLMNVHQSSSSFQNDGSWKELLHGWKNSEDL